LGECGSQMHLVDEDEQQRTPSITPRTGRTNAAPTQSRKLSAIADVANCLAHRRCRIPRDNAASSSRTACNGPALLTRVRIRLPRVFVFALDLAAQLGERFPRYPRCGLFVRA